jgi:hypothetical protein
VDNGCGLRHIAEAPASLASQTSHGAPPLFFSCFFNSTRSAPVLFAKDGLVWEILCLFAEPVGKGKGRA